jgi:hypothetical protein
VSAESSQQRFDAREQLLGREWLGEIIIGSSPKAPKPLLQAVKRAQHNNRCRVAKSPHRVDDIQTIDVAWQDTVQDHLRATSGSAETGCPGL